MPHSDYIQPYGVWPVPLVPTPKRLSALDGAIAKTINGDAGGTWSPTSPIIIGGAGMVLNGGGTSALLGGVSTRSGGKIVLGHNDFPTFGAARTRTILMPLRPTTPNSSAAYGRDSDMSPQFGCLRSTIPDGNVGSRLTVPIPKRYLHNGATLTRVTLAWRVGQPHNNGAPTIAPSIAIWRITTTGGTIVALNSTPQLQVATSGDAYYLKGNAQTLVYNCNQNNVIDTTQFQYAFVWSEESGGLLGASPTLNVFHSLKLAYTTIADQRFE
mgnify:FL=1